MDTYDLHGLLQEEAFKLIDQVISQARLKQTALQVRLITGRGIIRDKLPEFLRQYDLKAALEWSSDAAFILTID